MERTFRKDIRFLNGEVLKYKSVEHRPFGHTKEEIFKDV